MTKEELLERIQENHKYHTSSSKVEMYEQVRILTANCASKLVEICPIGRELSLALTAMEEAMFWSNAAIARSEN